MIMRSDFTLDELKNDSDPLSYVCHSVSKLKMIANVIQTKSMRTDTPPFEIFQTEDVLAMGEIIEDCALEIKTLVDIAEDQGHLLFHENKRLKAEIYELKHNLQ